MVRSVFPVNDCLPPYTDEFLSVMSDISSRYRKAYVFMSGYSQSFHNLITSTDPESNIDYLLYYSKSLKLECFELHGFSKTSFQKSIDKGMKFKDAIAEYCT